ncbi:uncharacterized protein LOC141914638 [Tubulanus polymorphus]|uniref:uncharacterized protein LOC141914638 n=1 Tax=Tubulanus polymorphus TaxID=672921 RepID=UPI003DA50D81
MEDTQLNRSTITRTAIRQKVDDLVVKSSTIVEDFRTTEDDVDLLNIYIEQITEKLSRLEKLDSTIEDLTPLTHLSDTIQEAEDFRSSVIEKRGRIIRFVEKAKHTTQPHNSSMNNSGASATPFRPNKVNLPKLTLAKFDGDLLKWQEFIDGFNSAVNDDPNLDDVVKFQYLRAQLNGEAYRTIEGLALTASNDANALQVLIKRYGQPQIIISAYMRALWELSRPTEDMQSLMEFSDKLETYIRGLSALGKNEDSYGDLLTPIILDKLPGMIRRQITRDNNGANWNLQSLRDALSREITAFQAGVSVYPETAHLGTTSAFHVGNAIKRKPLKCTFCKGTHFASDCVLVTEPEKRLDIVKRDKLCFNCMGTHRSRDCKSKNTCKKCRGKHHTLLCGSSLTETREISTKNRPQNPQNGSRSDSHDVKTVHQTYAGAQQPRPDGPILLKTAVAEIFSPSTSANNRSNGRKINILLDEGSHRSFITTRISVSLNLPHLGQEEINLATFGEQLAGRRLLQRTNFNIASSEGSPILIEALVIPTISTPISNLVNNKVLDLPHLRNLTLAEQPSSITGDFDIDVLIGADYYWSIVGDNTVKGYGPTAVSSRIGYLLSGPIPSHTLLTGVRNSTVLNVSCVRNMDLNSHRGEEVSLQSFWDLETIGIKDDASLIKNRGLAYSDYIKTHLTVDSDGRYTAKLPWKESHAPLPDNRHVAEARTRSMIRRLSAEMRTVYDAIIEEQLSRDFIEDVTHDISSIGHYLPHRGVKKDSTTTPLRIVFDCSCRVGSEPSLNDCLETGPPLLNDLVSILLRFRLYSTGISTDIEKAFLQIRLHEHDRKYTKFLWLTDPNDPESDFKVLQFKSILFGAVSSPFVLNATVKSHLANYDCETAGKLAENIYVDNIVTGVTSEDKAINFYAQSNEIMNSAGLALRAWATNCQRLRNLASSDGVAESKPIANVLGIRWDTHNDTLSIKVDDGTSDLVTKREVVSAASKLYDPLGFLAPVQVRAKMYIQELWKLNLGWDDPVQDESMREKWFSIRNDLSRASEIVLSRKYLSQPQTQNYEIHVFADSSKAAFGAVVYLRNQHDTSFVMSKTRVAPVKELTIPRLELLAALTGSKLIDYVTESLGSEIAITKKVLWSDSQIVLCWLNSDRKLPVFVSNRVKQIKSIKIDEYRYCPTSDNPADILSRGIDSEKLRHSNLWWFGPEWLKHGDWPVDKLYADTSTVNILHINDPQPGQVEDAEDERIGLVEIIDIERFIELGSLLRVTAYVFLFVAKLQRQTDRSAEDLTPDDIARARTAWIKAVQNANYSNEIFVLQGNHAKSRAPLTKQLRLFIGDDSLLRVGGRLHNAPIDYGAKFPILLPPKGRFTELTVIDAHARALHLGTESTINRIRQTYWIQSIRKVVKSLLRKCYNCKITSGQPYPLPDPAPLQKSRLTDAPPFTVTGVDFTGHLFVRDNNREAKAYIILFTCANTRAVHLEVVSDMSCATFLLAFRRFAARRSLPQKLISDNGSAFVAAAGEIKKLLDIHSVRKYMLEKNVEWVFIPKAAPWHGGFWERLVGLTKQVLKRVLVRAYISMSELITLVAEIEMVINNRPLTYLSDDVTDPEPLTPSHLLHGRVMSNLPHLSDTDAISDPEYGVSINTQNLQKRAQRVMELFEHFRSRWTNEYVIALRERHLSMRNNGRTSEIRSGDVVLVHDDQKRRINWKLAIVTKLNYGNDGAVRSAEIRMGTTNTSRPINKLFPLEINTDMDFKEPGPVIASDPRPVRNAARKARAKIVECLK